MIYFFCLLCYNLNNIMNGCVIFDTLSILTYYLYGDNYKNKLINKIYYDCTSNNCFKQLKKRVKDENWESVLTISTKNCNVVGLEINLNFKDTNYENLSRFTSLNDYLKNLNISFDHIKFLILNGNKYSIIHCNLSKFYRLKSLSVYGLSLNYLAPKKYWPGLDELKQSRQCLTFPNSLKYLNIDYCYIDGRCLDNLDCLKIFNCFDSLIDHIDLILKLNNLHSIIIWDCNINAFRSIKTCKNLKLFHIHNTFNIEEIVINHQIDNFMISYDEHDFKKYYCSIKKFEMNKNSKSVVLHLGQRFYEKILKDKIFAENLKLKLY